MQALFCCQEIIKMREKYAVPAKRKYERKAPRAKGASE